MADPALAGMLRGLEESLLRPETRHDAAALEALLAPEFVEFGSSGRVFSRAAIMALLATEGHAPAPALEAFACELLASGVALVTCRIVHQDGAGSLRSSVWVERDGQWTMRFHQGTRMLNAP